MCYGEKTWRICFCSLGPKLTKIYLPTAFWGEKLLKLWILRNHWFSIDNTCLWWDKILHILYLNENSIMMYSGGWRSNSGRFKARTVSWWENYKILKIQSETVPFPFLKNRVKHEEPIKSKNTFFQLRLFSCNILFPIAQLQYVRYCPCNNTYVHTRSTVLYSLSEATMNPAGFPALFWHVTRPSFTFGSIAFARIVEPTYKRTAMQVFRFFTIIKF